MGELKQINIKNWTYYFNNDMINIKIFDPNLLKINKKSFKGIGIYNIGYITIKKMMIVEIFIVLIFCICVLIIQIDILENNVQLNTWFSTLQMKIKSY